MAERRLTQKAKEMVSSGRALKPWVAPGQSTPYMFEGDFYHNGVDLKAHEVTSIMADQVFQDALSWASKWNTEHPDELFFFAGIDFQGPVDGYWESKGEKYDWAGIPKGRYHKFGGNGKAHILTKA